MSRQKRKPRIVADPKIGILYNLPIKSGGLDYVSEADVEEELQTIKDSLRKMAIKYRSFSLKDRIEPVIKKLKSYKPDVVVNLCEAAYGYSQLEMNVAAMLELLRIPYTGSPPIALSLGLNKGLSKDIMKAKGIPTPKYQILDSLKDWKQNIDYPLFVKPIHEDASLGISKESFVRNEAELEKRVKYIIKRYKQQALVEQYIAGRELNVAIIGDKILKVLPISEILFMNLKEPKIVDYSAKWIKDSVEYKNTKPVCPANLPPSLKDKVESFALQAYKALRCRDYARIDIRLKNNIPYVLEVNPNPDISLDSGFVRSLKAAGRSFEDFVEEIIFFALDRAQLGKLY